MMDDRDRVDCRAVIAALAPEQRERLLAKSNRHGLVHLAAHLAAVAFLAVIIMRGAGGWPLLMLPLGILVMFLFTALHEATHGTAFRSNWLNRVVTTVCGFVVVVPPLWFKYFHLAHHRHTHDRARDPELEGGKPETWPRYLAYLSGLPVWRANLMVMLNNAMGRVGYAYVPAHQRSGIILESQVFLLGYGAVVAASIYFRIPALLFVWVIPVLLGQPFLRAYLLAEHTRCPHVANMLENTRTTFTWPLVRFIAWNMPYHAEHHANPNVPFWKLPEFHRMIGAHLRSTERGYLRFHRKLAAGLRNQPMA